MLSVLINKSLQTDPILINDFSRLAPLISNKLNGPSKLKTFVMAERKNEPPNNNSYNIIGTIVSPRVSGLQNNRRQNRRTEESIFPNNFGHVQFSQFTVGPPVWHPLQPTRSDLIYQNFTQSVLLPNLRQPYFHRPNQNNWRQLHNAASTAGQSSLNGLRFWERISTTNNSGLFFSVMSYNVLAQDLLDQHPYLYNSHKKESLKWDIRWNNLLDEIRELSPDILCLQEVQKTHLDEYFSTFENLGYQGVYKQRTGPRTDGCAIYFKTSLLTLTEHTTVEYNQPQIPLLDRDNVAIIAKFAPKSHPSSHFVVATTHLLYNPKRQDVRLAQTQLLLAEIDRIAFNGSRKYLPVILTGDLNSTPDSSLYKFITRGRLHREDLAAIPSPKGLLLKSLRITDKCQHADLLGRRKDGGLTREEEIKLIELKHSEREEGSGEKKGKVNDELFNSGSLSHQFSLQSVYQHKVKGDMEATTFQDEWISVDYIFFSKNRHDKGGLILLERYRLPTRKELYNRRITIPNRNLGSDHLALMAKFKLEV